MEVWWFSPTIFDRSSNFLPSTNCSRMKVLIIFAILAITPLTFVAQNSENESNKIPITAEEWFEYGWLKSRMAGNEEARDAFERAIALKPDYAEAKYSLGVWYLRPKRRCALGRNLKLTKEPDPAVLKAIDALNDAIKLIPNSPAPYERLGEAYKRLGSKTDAVNAYKAAIVNGSDDLFMYLDLARIYEELNQHDGAISQYQAISKKYVELRDLKKEETTQERESEMHIGARLAFESSYRELSRLYFKLDRLNDALTTYLQIFDLRLNDSDTNFELGQLYVRLGDRTNAIVQYEALKRIADSETHTFSKKELKKDARNLLKQIESL